MDGVGWQMLELGPRSLRKVEGEELEDEVVVLDSHHATREAVIFQPCTGIQRPIVHGNICRRPHLRKELHLADCTFECVGPFPGRARASLVPSIT